MFFSINLCDHVALSAKRLNEKKIFFTFCAAEKCGLLKALFKQTKKLLTAIKKRNNNKLKYLYS